jgi:hypothetical protein
VKFRARETENAHQQCTRPQLKNDSKLFGYSPLERLPRPPFSTDIFPSDFDLFGNVKSTLIGREILDGIDLLGAVTEILNGVSDDELQCFFRNWIECAKRAIDAGRDYLTEYIFSTPLSHSRSTPLWLI